MQERGSTWVYSPSDLIRFLENEALTWFDRFDKENPGVLVRDAECASDELVQSAGEVPNFRCCPEPSTTPMHSGLLPIKDSNNSA